MPRIQRRILPPFLLLVALLAAAPSPGSARGIATKAEQAFMMDFQTGAVLLSKNADEPAPPSSMSKVMTAYILFEAIRRGQVALDDRFAVSRKAWKKGGSKMFVEVGKRIRVEDLIRGIVVQSGNDASIVVAEGLAGSEEAFAETMNDRAGRMGLTGSHFTNATGWPDPNHYATVRDLAMLAYRMIVDFPEFYHYYAEKEFTFNGIKQGNRNPLLYKRSLKADGVKTGHTEAAGYGLMASAARDGRRLILVLNGLESKRARAEESERLMLWAFREFRNFTMFKPGETVMRADVWLGTEPWLDLVSNDPVLITVPKRIRGGVSAKVTYVEPIPAPIRAGQMVAKLTIDVEGASPAQFPLVAADSVPRATGFAKLFSAVDYMVFGAGD